jgi:hypothetical protein
MLQLQVDSLGKPVLHIWRPDLYSALGWEGLPVESVLTSIGILTHRVAYLPPRHVQVADEHGDLTFDTLLAELRWLLTVRWFCRGVDVDDVGFQDYGVMNLKRCDYPELRAMDPECPVVMTTDRGRRKRCLCCERQQKCLERRRKHAADTDPSTTTYNHSSIVGIDDANQGEEVQSSPPQQKKKTASATQQIKTACERPKRKRKKGSKKLWEKVDFSQHETEAEASSSGLHHHGDREISMLMSLTQGIVGLTPEEEMEQAVAGLNDEETSCLDRSPQGNSGDVTFEVSQLVQTSSNVDDIPLD